MGYPAVISMNEIINQHNDLIDLPLKNFNSSEVDILNAICYRCQEQGTNEIVLSFDEIKKLAHFKGKDKKELITAIDNTNEKLINLKFKISTEEKILRFVLFPTYLIDVPEETLTIQVNEIFSYLLNNLSGNYTSLELKESAQLKSVYAKAIYKKLRRFRDIGKWSVKFDEFKEYLAVPKSYKSGQIPAYIIKPSIKELEPFFPGLTYETKYKKAGRGRPVVDKYIFSFEPQPHKVKGHNIPVSVIANKTGWEPTGKFCPVCHKPIYQRFVENDNGQYDCNYLTNNFSDLLTREQIEELERPEATPDQEENKKRMSELMKDILKEI